MSCDRRKPSRLQTWRLVSLKVRIISSKEQGLQAVRLVEYFSISPGTRFLSSSSDCSKPFITTATSLRTRRSRRVNSVYWRTADAKEKNCWVGYFRFGFP